MTSPSLSTIILAAGKGTRMKSGKAKVLHEVFFAPMVQHVIEATLPLQPERTVVIVGHQNDKVEEALHGYHIEFALQKEQLGTGHAVLTAETAMGETNGHVMILCGDTPLIRPQTLQAMYSHHLEQGATITLMSTILENPATYGRIISDASGKVHAIVEHKDADESQLLVKEINAGIYCVATSFLFSALKNVGTDNSQGEIYFTDIIKLAVQAGQTVEKYTADYAIDVLGVNSRVELAEAHQELRMRRNRGVMLQGVTMLNPETIEISPDSEVGMDSTIEAGVKLLDSCRIGTSCRVGQGAILSGCTLSDGVHIAPYSCLNNKQIGAGSAFAASGK